MELCGFIRYFACNMPVAAVTGASGFLGSHLCALLLQKGYRVRAAVKYAVDIDRVVQFCSHYGVENTDMLSVYAGVWLYDTDAISDCFKGADVVFHCAALVGFRKSDHNQLMEINGLGTENVVNACLRTGIKHLVHVSSVAALGREDGRETTDENTVWTDSTLNTSYAISKHLAELAVWRGVEEGLNASMVNPGIILGFCKSESGSGMIYKRAKKGSLLYPSGSNGFVGVEDVVKLMVAVYEYGLWGKRFVAVAENLTYKTILDDFADAYKKPRPSIRITPTMARFLAAIVGFFEGLGINTPIPAHGLISTSSKNQYKSINLHLVPKFRFTLIKEVIRASVVAKK